MKSVAAALDMTPYEVIHELGDVVFNDVKWGNYWNDVWDMVNRPEFAQLVKDKGYDGIKLIESGEDAYGVLEPTQIKSADPVTYADDGSVIPLSERFNPESDDLRYSLATTDADGKVLKDGQMEYFKNSQARDEQGRLVRVFHSTDKGGFTIFDPSYSDDKRSIFFTSNYRMSRSYVKYKDESRTFNAMEFGLPEIEPHSIMDMQDVVDYLASLTDSQKDQFHLVIYADDGMSYDSWTPAGKNASIEAFFEKYDDDFKDIEGYIEDIDSTIGEFSDKEELFNELEECVKYINDSYGENNKDDSGTYECYLNLENPMIIDCKGSNWDSIREEGFEHIYVRTLQGDLDDPTDLIYYITDEYKGIGKKYESIEEIREDYGDGFAEQIEEIDEAYNGQKELFTWDGAAFNPEEEGYWPEEGNTRYWCLEAEARGYDGVIFLNLADNGPYGNGYETGDVYVAFNSNQVKDINNENPTENPDIRYSITPEDDALSSIAYAHAMDSSGEALEYYEKLIDMVDPETYNVRPFNEEKVADFYAALNADEAVVSADPVVEESRVRMARSKADFFNNLNTKWNDRWRTDNEVLDVKSVKKDIRELVMGVMSNSATDRKHKTELVNKMLMDVRTAYQLMKQDRQEVAASLLYHSALRMVEGAEFYIDDSFDQYKELKDFFKTTRISLGEEYWSDVDFGAFRKNNFGRMKLVKGNTNVDQIYMELADMFPEWFNVDETLAVPDMLKQMAHVLDVVQPYKEAYSSEAAADLAFDIADELYDIMVGGKEIKSLADQYKERYDRKTKAMKQRHAEAMLRMRKARDEGVQAERAKWRAKEEARKEKAKHNVEFERIQKTYNELTKRLLTNTKEKHIPEQYKRHLAELLKAFDLQTLRSKELESKRGYKAQNTIKLEAMKTALERIEAKSQLFHVNDAITDIIDELLGISEDRSAQRNIEGLTLDELTYTELHNINHLLKALLFEFNNYEKVWAEGKKQQAADIGHKQNDISLEHAKQFGPGRDFQTPILQSIDQILNLDMVTPAYLFRRIDPNSEGLGMMWKELRKSFDKYIRNTAQLNDWIEEIVGDYHEKGKVWSKYGAGDLTKWRSDNYALPFNLTHGTISLTPAQMMSIYCLAGRDQAMDHMLREGIVVSPVSFQAKMMSDVKKKADKARPVQLTHADIQTIIERLTPEQISVAQKLQRLMATKMAAWGNEASMDVIGIELFKEENYFPIRSDKAGLTKDLDPNQFEQALRSFGFTKAVKPKAGNAIMVDDIFDVVVDHCNNMNLYNSYTKAVNDFMKVYNYKEEREEGTYSVERALLRAFSEKTPKYIMQFIQDLNGNVHKRNTGMEAIYNAMLSNAKKTSVFVNWRVAAQQPTAIERAFYVIDRKYYNPADLAANSVPKVITEDTKEMWEHCPIALWKSWGYYDINMGKNIDDIIMNNGSKLDDFATAAYGKLDNAAWTAIWKMVKREMRDTHPDVEIGTDEYWNLANERMTEIIDLTQLVDSPMHRSHAMRNKGYWSKTKTAFAGEPTITFNMLRDGLIRTEEARKTGNYKLAGKILLRTGQVYVMQTLMVAAAQALVDALRFKNPDPDDDDDRFLHLFWVNFAENFKNEINPLTKIYVVKDWVSAFQGWQNRELATNGIDKLILGWRQLNGDPYARSSTPWYFNIADGLGYLYGVPIPTMRKGVANMMRRLGLESPALNAVSESLDNMVQKDKDGEEKTGFAGMLLGAAATVEDKLEIKGEGFFGKILAKAEADSGDSEGTEGSVSKEELKKQYPNLSDEELDEIVKAGNKRAEKEAAGPISEEELLAKALKASAGLEGEEKNKKIYSAVANGMKAKIENGEYHDIAKMRKAIEAAGGDINYFDQQVINNSKTALKKSIKFDATPEEINDQALILHYLVSHGVSQEEISRDIVYESDAAKDMKVAFKTGDEELIQEAMKPLIDAGITEEDIERLYQNRNKMQIDKYEGRYKDRLKSTGSFAWPTEGRIITSQFGNRNSPGGIGSTNHPAIDIGASMGTPVGAADGGTVIYVGYNGGYGNSVGVKHDNGMVTYYNHLSGFSVNEGDVVTQGQEVGQVGSTGNSTGPHLDFKVLDADGNAIDPEQLLDLTGVVYDLDA